MINNYNIKHYIKNIKKVIFFLFFFIVASNSYSDVYNIENQILKEKWNNSKNFREDLINKAILNSFKELSFRLLIDNEKWKIRNIESTNIKPLVSKISILEEKKIKSEYEVKLSIFFDKEKVKSFYNKRNIIFTDLASLPVMVFPILKNNNNYYIWDDNLIIKNWSNTNYKNYLVDFMFPEGDLFDRKNLSFSELDINKINEQNILKRYGLNNSLIILINLDSEENNAMYKLNLSNSVYSQKFSKKLNISNKNKFVNNIIDEIKSSAENIWKNKNIILTTSAQSIIFVSKIKSLTNLNSLRDVILQNKFINKIEDIEISSNFYRGKFYFSGSINDIKKSLEDSKVFIKEDLENWIITYNE